MQRRCGRTFTLFRASSQACIVLLGPGTYSRDSEERFPDFPKLLSWSWLNGRRFQRVLQRILLQNGYHVLSDLKFGVLRIRIFCLKLVD